MLGGDTGGETVGATEGDVAGLDTAGHVVRLRGGVDDLIDGLHGEVEGHELALVSLESRPESLTSNDTYDRVKTREGSTDSQTGETGLGNRRVNDSLGTESIQQALGDLVSKYSDSS